MAILRARAVAGPSNGPIVPRASPAWRRGSQKAGGGCDRRPPRSADPAAAAVVLAWRDPVERHRANKIALPIDEPAMSIKSDKWIRRMASQHGMIEPFEPGQVREGADGQRIVSYGTSSYGYDIRCAREFKVFTNLFSTVVDPKNFDEKSFVDIEADVCVIPPNSFALARTVEYFRIPRNVLTICLGKSTYARCGIIVNVTPFEPEWEGFVTLEFSNTTPLPAKIYAGEGCAQVLFFESDEVCETSYKDRGGKYQGQRGVTLPKA
jgi:dCTP deaminase